MSASSPFDLVANATPRQTQVIDHSSSSMRGGAVGRTLQLQHSAITVAARYDVAPIVKLQLIPCRRADGEFGASVCVLHGDGARASGRIGGLATREHYASELRSLHGDRIALAPAYLKALADRGARPMVELKSPEAVAPGMTVIKSVFEEDPLLVSFSPEVLERAKDRGAAYRGALLPSVEEPRWSQIGDLLRDPVGLVKDSHANVAVVHWSVASLVARRLHRAEIPVYAWTVNERWLLRHCLRNRRIQGIMTARYERGLAERRRLTLP